MNAELTEDRRIAKRFEHRAMKFLREVDLSGGIVAELQPEDEAADVPGFYDVIEHWSPQRLDLIQWQSLTSAIPIL